MSRFWLNPFTPVIFGASVLFIVSGCTVSSGRSRRTNPTPAGYYQNPNQPPPGAYPQNPPPAPNGYAQPAPYGQPAQAPAQYTSPAATGGLCAAVQRRQYACPSESPPGGCEHEERCLAGLGRPDALAMLSDCVQKGPCNLRSGIFNYCLDSTRQRLQPTPQSSQLATLCSAAATACSGSLAQKCSATHLLSDAVAAQVAQCLAVPDCQAKNRCIERLYDSRGCP